MEKIYHDPKNPQPDAVERYALSPELQQACDMLTGKQTACCCDKKNTYHIYIMRSQVIYDIEAQLSIMTKARRNENQQQDNNIENIDSVRPLIDRWFSKYLALAKRKLASVLVDDKLPSNSNNIKDKEEIDLTLAIGEWWNNNALDPLTEAVHDLLVNGCIYEYLLIYLSPNDPVTVAKEQQKETALEEIHNALLSYHPSKIRKAMHPFP